MKLFKKALDIFIVYENISYMLKIKYDYISNWEN